MSAINEFLLIELVESHSEVWNCNSVQFRNKNVKAGAWRDIARCVGATADECQSTWKKLRDRYTRIKRMLPSGSEGGRKQWDKENVLRFLDKVVVTRRTTSNAIETNCNESENSTYNMYDQVMQEVQENIRQDENSDSEILTFPLQDPEPGPSNRQEPVDVPPSSTTGIDVHITKLDLQSTSTNASKRKRKNAEPNVTDAIIQATRTM